MNTRSVTVGASAFVHLAAIGLLLTLRPAIYPDPAPTFEAVEVSIVPEQPPAGSLNELSGNNPAERPVDVSAMPFPSPTRPDGTATGQPSDGPEASLRGMFDLPAQPAFKSRAPSAGLEMLGTMLDCQATEGSNRGEPRRPPRAHLPCAYADLALRAPITRFRTDGSEPAEGARWADEAYRSFKTIQPMFDESLFPEKVPNANRALKKWFMGLFR